MPKSAEVIVIGSGIGGLCCAGLTARAGKDVLVLEAHSQPGGAAHGFERQGYHFESGPSLWSGLSRWPSSNPLAQILRALDQPLDVLTYKDWDVLFPEGHLRVGVGGNGFERVVERLRGPGAVAEWQRLPVGHHRPPRWPHSCCRRRPAICTSRPPRRGSTRGRGGTAARKRR